MTTVDKLNVGKWSGRRDSGLEGKSISLLHPTIRPGAWEAACHAWYQACDHPENVEYILVPEKSAFSESLPELIKKISFRWRVVEWNTHAASLVGGFNYAAELSHNPILVTAADDCAPPSHWDTEIYRILGNKINSEVVIWGNTKTNEIDEQYIAAPILTRAYYEKFGYIFYPGYSAFWADGELWAVAKQRDSIIDCRRTFQFNCENFRPADKINLRHAATNKEGEELYNKRKAEGFPK